MQPVPVAVSTIFYVILVYLDSIPGGELVSFGPGGNFKLEQLNVGRVIGVPELGMTEFVQ